MDGAKKKKKKKSRKSKHKEWPSPETLPNGTESSALQDVEPTRPSKRKHESEHEHKQKKKKKKKKKRHVTENDTNGASVHVAETAQNQSAAPQSEGPASHKPSKTAQATADAAQAAAPPSQAESVDYETTGELNKKGRPKKQRGARIGGKDNLKVGFFVPAEIEKLEKFKLDFCNAHRLSGEQFDTMVQHSERDGGDFPCPDSITSKNEFWADIYGTLPDRDRRSVNRFMRRHFQVTTQKPHEWTDEQDEELVQLHAEHGPKWVFIAKLLGRSDDDVTQRWKNKLEHRDTMRRGPWDKDELRAFMDAMQQIWEGYRQILHDNAGNDVYEMDEKLVGWGGVSNTLNNVRSRQQCADKWRKIRKAVLAKRRDGFPDAVFDYTKVAKKSARHAASSAKSSEYVVEDGDDDDNVGDNSLPTSAATTPAPKFGFADEQEMMALAADTANSPDEGSPSPQHDIKDGDGAEVNDCPEEPDATAAANVTASPITPATPLSASGTPKRDTGRMARIKAKIKEANKSSASKKRKRTEVETPEQAAADEEATGVEKSNEQPPTTGKTSEEERKEKRRKRKEKKAQAERERVEADAAVAEAVALQATESENKTKKHKKGRKSKSIDTADIAEVVPAASLDKKKKKKKHRKSEAEADGVSIAGPESPESSRKQDKKDKKSKKRATQEGSSSGGDAEPQIRKSPTPAPAPAVDQDQAQSGSDDYSDDSIKMEETDSD